MIEIFRTVPIVNNTMVRNEEGRKVDENGNPIRFKGEWLQYVTKRNTDNTPLLAAIASTDFIGIDIDTSVLFNKAMELLKDYDLGYVALSLPEEANKGGHILFRFDKGIREQLLPLRKHLKTINIDVQMDNSLIYLATKENKTKKLVTPKLKSLEGLTQMPSIFLTWLKSLVTDMLLNDKDSVKMLSTDTFTTDYYGYVTAKLEPAIVGRLTPKRDFPDVKAMDDIPYGLGTEWLLQVRKKLMLDVSVSKEAFKDTILYLNSLWDDPMPESRVLRDIERDINSPEFEYDPNWKRRGFMFTTQHKHTIEVLYDLRDSSYITFNRTTQEVIRYPNFSSVSDAVLSLTKKRYTKDILLPKCIAVYEVNNPMKASFMNKDEHGRDIFNIFRPSEGLRILRDIDVLENPRKPSLILWFFKHLIPNDDIREKFLGYLKYKYATYDYSPLYFVLAGAAGAGKGILIHEILPYLSSPDRMYSVQYEEFMDKFNSYLADIDWLEIDEGGEGFTKKEGEKLVANLKRLTGSAYITVVNKGKDSSASKATRHFITPIISTNLSTKLITDSIVNDRRMVFIKSPDKLEPKLPLTIDGEVIKDTREFIYRLRRELPHFAYYLKSLEPISSQDYLSNTNWKNEEYEEYVESTMTYNEKLYNKACLGDTDGFVEVLIDAGVDPLTIDNMFKLYGLYNIGDESYPASILLYNTQRTRELGLKSLEEVMIETPSLGGEARKIFKTIKEVKGVRHEFKFYKLNIIKFNKPYTKQSYMVEDCDVVDF